MWVAVCVGGWILALIVMAATLPAEIAAWTAVALAGLAVVATGGILVKSMLEDGGHKSARLQHSKYLLPADFDEDAGRLLGRPARGETVLEATVTRRGLLDDVKNDQRGPGCRSHVGSAGVGV